MSTVVLPFSEGARAVAAASSRPESKVTVSKSPKGHAGPLLVAVITVAALCLGWQQRDAGYISSEHGAGYALGIIGGVMMALLLLYPLRKKQVALFRWGPVRYWFAMHMLFGIAGPVIILFHSNFRLGAVNSNVALFSMLLVAASGLVGRYFYTRIYYGLDGVRTTLGQLQERVTAEKGGFAKLFRAIPEAATAMTTLEAWLLRKRSWPVQLFTLPLAAIRCWYVRRRLTRLVHRKLVRHARRSEWSAERLARAQGVSARFIAGYVETMRRVAEIGIYERLFSWWHILHFPLFLMMLLAGVVHVVAVHMY